MQSEFLLNVVIAEGASILQLLSGKDQSLLIRGNSFLVLDLGLDVVDRVRRLDIQGNGLSRQGLDENLHGDVMARDCWTEYRRERSDEMRGGVK